MRIDAEKTSREQNDLKNHFVTAPCDFCDIQSLFRQNMIKPFTLLKQSNKLYYYFTTSIFKKQEIKKRGCRVKTS